MSSEWRSESGLVVGPGSVLDESGLGELVPGSDGTTCWMGLPTDLVEELLVCSFLPPSTFFPSRRTPEELAPGRSTPAESPKPMQQISTGSYE